MHSSLVFLFYTDTTRFLAMPPPGVRRAEKAQLQKFAAVDAPKSPVPPAQQCCIDQPGQDCFDQSKLEGVGARCQGEVSSEVTRRMQEAAPTYSDQDQSTVSTTIIIATTHGQCV